MAARSCRRVAVLQGSGGGQGRQSRETRKGKPVSRLYIPRRQSTRAGLSTAFSGCEQGGARAGEEERQAEEIPQWNKPDAHGVGRMAHAGVSGRRAGPDGRYVYRCASAAPPSTTPRASRQARWRSSAIFCGLARKWLPARWQSGWRSCLRQRPVAGGIIAFLFKRLGFGFQLFCCRLDLGLFGAIALYHPAGTWLYWRPG